VIEQDELAAALAALRAGAAVVVPTDTVYGVAARFDAPDAIACVFSLKDRPLDKPIPVLAARVEDLESIVATGPGLTALARRFWPGPLTVVTPRAVGFTHDLGGGADSVGVRVPADDLARALRASAGPLAVTSANRSGEPPAVTVAEARAIFGDAVAAYVDGGPRKGTPSTVVSLVGSPRLLRGGPIDWAVVRAVLADAERRV
jgi:L-threonylcarbamoyladenylate synthase